MSRSQRRNGRSWSKWTEELSCVLNSLLLSLRPVVVSHQTASLFSSREEEQSVWRVGATKWLPSSNKICTLWLCYASKMLKRLKCFSRRVTWVFKSLVFTIYIKKKFFLGGVNYMKSGHVMFKLLYACWAIIVLNQKYTVIMMDKINIQHQYLWISCITNGFSQSDH